MRASEYLESCVWKHPKDYGGFSPDGDYLIACRTRDSDLLEESNFTVATRTLAAEFYAADYPHYGKTADDYPDRPDAYIFRAGHWACGWVEYLLVRHDAHEHTLQEAGEIICSLADYPVLSEDHYSELQWETASKQWESMPIADRVDLCRECGASIFAARSDCFPSDDTGRVIELLAGA